MNGFATAWNDFKCRTMITCPAWLSRPVRFILWGRCSYPAIQTERFDIYRQRVARPGHIPRTVYSAWYREQKPGDEGCFAFKSVCSVTLHLNLSLFNNKPYVEWIEVDEGYRRLNIATEVMLKLIECHGPMEYSGATKEGEAFCEKLDEITS